MACARLKVRIQAWRRKKLACPGFPANFCPLVGTDLSGGGASCNLAASALHSVVHHPPAPPFQAGSLGAMGSRCIGVEGNPGPVSPSWGEAADAVCQTADDALPAGMEQGFVGRSGVRRKRCVMPWGRSQGLCVQLEVLLTSAFLVAATSLGGLPHPGIISRSLALPDMLTPPGCR